MRFDTALQLHRLSLFSQIVRTLYHYPCNIYQVDSSSQNALHMACVARKYDVVEYLCSFSREKPRKTYDQRQAIKKYHQKRQRNRQDQLDAGIAEIDIQESDEEVEPDWEVSKERSESSSEYSTPTLHS